MASLGVHEHRNNPVDKQYSGNLRSPGTYCVWFKAAPTDAESDSLYYGLDGAVAKGPNAEAVLTQPYEERLIAKKAFNRLYLAIGQEQACWTDRLFDDAGRREGQARLGYGRDGENKEVRYGLNEDNAKDDGGNKYITTYFRKHFAVANPSAFAYLRISVLRDDGVIVYLNGDGVARCENIPSGPVNYYCTFTPPFTNCLLKIPDGFEKRSLHCPLAV